MLRFVAYSIYSSHLVHQGVALEVVGGGRRVVAPLLRAPVPPRPSTSTARMKLDVSRVPLVGAEGLPALWAVRRGEVGAAVVELEQPPFGAGVRAFRAGEHLWPGERSAEINSEKVKAYFSLKIHSSCLLETLLNN